MGRPWCKRAATHSFLHSLPLYAGFQALGHSFQAVTASQNYFQKEEVLILKAALLFSCIYKKRVTNTQSFWTQSWLTKASGVMGPSQREATGGSLWGGTWIWRNVQKFGESGHSLFWIKISCFGGALPCSSQYATPKERAFLPLKTNKQTKKKNRKNPSLPQSPSP